MPGASAFVWACSCGEGGASSSATREAALREGELHVCRSGRFREAHRVLVWDDTGAAA